MHFHEVVAGHEAEGRRPAATGGRSPGLESLGQRDETLVERLGDGICLCRTTRRWVEPLPQGPPRREISSIVSISSPTRSFAEEPPFWRMGGTNG